MIKHINKFIYALIVGMFLLTGSAQAIPLLDGKDLRIRYLFPDITTDFLSPKDVIVGAGIEADFGFGTPTVDVSDTNILFDFSVGGASASFNGFQFVDLTNTIDAFTSVTISSTNLLFDATDIIFDADNIWINFEGLASGSDGFVSIDIASAVPEPAALALMGLGFLALTFVRRKKSKL